MKRFFAVMLTLAFVFSCVPAMQASAATQVAEDDNGTYYSTLEAALNAVTSGTVTLLADATAGNVLLKPGVTLDLNGYTLTADLVFAFAGATIVDGGEDCTGGGLLKTTKDALVFAQGSGNTVIPVWNGTDGYIFTKVTFLQMAKAAGEGAAQYIFLPRFSNSASSALLADGGVDNGLKIKVCLTWNNGQSQQFYTYDDDLVKLVFDGTGKWVFDLQVTGIAGITDMVAQPVVAADCGAQAITAGTVLTTA